MKRMDLSSWTRWLYPATLQYWFFAIGFLGAVVASKVLGDFAFQAYQDLSQTFSQPTPTTSEPTRRPQSTEIIVAVIDTGIDLDQPLLKNKLWKNAKEIPGNGIDDDGNGFIDDIHGWNFAADSNVIDDLHGHGTHIAGIIAGHSKGDFQGLAPHAKIMVLKYYDPTTPGLDNLRNSTRALRYAVQMGAKIINYSGGGLEPNDEEKAILVEAARKGILVVAAAGNEKSNSDQRPFYPAGYGLKNILSVAAIDQNALILPSSNFGKKSVDVAAPGSKILSTLPGGKLGVMTGTSQATAYVSGTAAQILLQGPRGTRVQPLELKRRIIQTVTRSASLREKTKSGGRVELSRTLKMRDRNTSTTELHLINTSRISSVIFSPEFQPQAMSRP